MGVQMRTILDVADNSGAKTELSVLLEEGKVQLKLKEGATVSEERIQQAVADAGFEARSIVFVNEKARTPKVG